MVNMVETTYVELHREVVKGCGNVIGDTIRGSLTWQAWGWDDDTVNTITPDTAWLNAAGMDLDSLINASWQLGDSAVWSAPAKIEPTIFESKPAKTGEYPVITEY
jgi:hypothetical protein